MNRKRISRDQSSLTLLIAEFERFGGSGTGKRALTPLALVLSFVQCTNQDLTPNPYAT